MTTLYRPVLIESAEQAEALPDGSIVINDTGDRYNRAPRTGWHSAVGDRDLTEDLESTFLPSTITALVPIEAEKVHSEVRGVGHATHRLAGGPFVAYYVHEETA